MWGGGRGSLCLVGSEYWVGGGREDHSLGHVHVGAFDVQH